MKTLLFRYTNQNQDQLCNNAIYIKTYIFYYSSQVLAEEAHPVEDLDPSSIRELLTTSQSQLAQASGDQVSNKYA